MDESTNRYDSLPIKSFYIWSREIFATPNT